MINLYPLTSLFQASNARNNMLLICYIKKLIIRFFSLFSAATCAVPEFPSISLTGLCATATTVPVDTECPTLCSEIKGMKGVPSKIKCTPSGSFDAANVVCKGKFINAFLFVFYFSESVCFQQLVDIMPPFVCITDRSLSKPYSITNQNTG